MLQDILQELTAWNSKLIAVSKTKPVESIQVLYEMGQRDFGENRVQELLDKQALLPSDIRWHLIGHLQTNKVKYIAPFVHLIHSVDSEKLLVEINRQAARADRVIPVLLQFHIAAEETKYGFSLEEAEGVLKNWAVHPLEHVQIAGVMGMATFTDNEDQVRKEFKTLKQIFDSLKNTYFANDTAFREISMGMSGDYRLALQEGSTLVRIGSLLFGNR